MQEVQRPWTKHLFRNLKGADHPPSVREKATLQSSPEVQNQQEAGGSEWEEWRTEEVRKLPNPSKIGRE